LADRALVGVETTGRQTERRQEKSAKKGKQNTGRHGRGMQTEHRWTRLRTGMQTEHS
jgi:hypothetical protein